MYPFYFLFRLWQTLTPNGAQTLERNWLGKCKLYIHTCNSKHCYFFLHNLFHIHIFFRSANRRTTGRPLHCQGSLRCEEGKKQRPGQSSRSSQRQRAESRGRRRGPAAAPQSADGPDTTPTQPIFHPTHRPGHKHVAILNYTILQLFQLFLTYLLCKQSENFYFFSLL